MLNQKAENLRYYRLMTEVAMTEEVRFELSVISVRRTQKVLGRIDYPWLI